jgi:hypothetical protein
MKVPSRRSVASQLARRSLVLHSHKCWDLVLPGQKVVLLRYPVYHVDALNSLFDIASIQASQVEKTKERLRDDFCVKNSINVQSFKEKYDVRVSEDSSSVGIFDVLLQEDVDRKIDGFKRDVSLKIQEQMQSAEEIGCVSPIMIAHEMPKIDNVLAERDVDKVTLAVDRFELHCTTLIPSFWNTSIAFAQLALQFDRSKMIIVYVLSKSSMVRHTPCRLFAPYGDYYLVEIAVWD